MLVTARLDAELQHDLADEQPLPVAGVEHLDDVGARKGEQFGDAGELAGTIGQRDAQARVTVGCREPMRDDALQQQRVDVATREDGDGRSVGGHLSGEDGGDADRAGGLDDLLRALEEHEDGPGDVVVADGDDLVDVALAWYAFASAADAVDTTTTAFHLVDDHTVTVTFQITGPADKAIACVLEADDADHGVVGWKVVQYPASGTHAQAFTEQIPVTGIATTGFVNTCWVP